MSDIQEHEATAWEDINPPMALAPRHEPVSTSLERLQPATSEQFRNELVACLALVVPVGMTEEARRDWLRVAWETLKHLPADMLHTGCAKARETADHPSKIVPIITAETADWYERRRNSLPDSHPPALMSPEARPKKPLLDRRGEAMTEEEATELNGLLEGLGATARYRADGSRYLVTEQAA